MAIKNYVLDRADLEARYRLFHEFALIDQRRYYQRTLDRNRKASAQINSIRAFMALITGLASALAIFVVTIQPSCATSAFGTAFAAAASAQTAEAPAAPADQDATAEASPLENCGGWSFVLVILLITSVVAPAMGGAFSTLADLYQWDRLINVYESALENIEVADAKSPIADMDLKEYRASLQAYSLGTLSVMRDETAQWGQIIKTPDQLDAFIARSMAESQATAASVPSVSQLKTYNEDELRRLQERLDEAKALVEAQRVSPPPSPVSPPPSPASPPPAEPTLPIDDDTGGG
ncbi:MAG: hypothetical protein IT320_03385 [Anaerolineae bacterium]|nr:hypothetical protein [Anaerolineae bacterium]